LILRYAVARLTNRRRLRAETPAPSFFERAMSVAWVAPLRALPAIGAALLLYVGLDTLDLLFGPWGRTATAILKAVFVYSAVSSLVKAVLAPHEPQWRLVSLADGPTRRIGRLLLAITAVYALDAALTDVNRAFLVPLTVSVVQSFAASLAFAALLVGILLTPFAPPAGTASVHSPRWLKLPLWLAVLAILALGLLGYVALARFVAQQLVDRRRRRPSGGFSTLPSAR
jgi:small-conductance mechanosensitive channel